MFRIFLISATLATIFFSSYCKTSNNSESVVGTPILKENIRIRALSGDNTIWLTMEEPDTWLATNKAYSLKYGTEELPCESLPGVFTHTKEQSGTISHRIASSVDLSKRETLFLCIVQESRLLHKEKVSISQLNPFAELKNAPPIVNYARRCAQEISYIPVINCQEGVEIPITVNGQKPDSYPSGLTCDNPAMLDYQERAESQCVPYSRIQKIPLSDPDTMGVIICRRYKLRDKMNKLYDDVSIIIHRKSTGATCFFQMPEDINRPLDGTRVPPPHELPSSTPEGKVSVEDFWLNPQESSRRFCNQCHDSDPFVHSPYVAGTGQVPSNPKGLYKIVGKEFSDWPIVQGIDTKSNNVCTSCHRVGNMFSCNSFLDYSVGKEAITGVLAESYAYPKSHWMPPNNSLRLEDWNQAYEDQIEQIRSCCRNPNQSFCQQSPITENFGF